METRILEGRDMEVETKGLELNLVWKEGFPKSVTWREEAWRRTELDLQPVLQMLP